MTNISTRFVTVKSFDGTEILIPNEKIISDVVINESVLSKETRQEFFLTLTHETNIKQAIELIESTIKNHKNVKSKKSIQIVIEKIDPLGIKLKGIYWINNVYLPAKETHSDILQEIHTNFKEFKIKFAKS